METYTELGLNFFMYASKLFKGKAIETLMERGFKICTSYKLFGSEI